MTENSALVIATRQLAWYGTHKTRARWSHYAGELAAVALSFLAAIAGILGWDPAVPAVAGSLLVVLALLRGLFQSRESWIAWAMAQAELQKAIDYYATKIEPYDGPDRDRQLVRRVWEVRNGETEAWKSRKSSPPTPTPEELQRIA
jgi:Protein of unknown function (DUF4231)